MMGKPFLVLALAIAAAFAFLAVSAGLRGAAMAQPAVDLTGEWGYVYSMGGDFYVGGCVVTYSQTDSSFVSTPGGLMQCDGASDGAVTGTLKGPDGLTVNQHIDFAGPFPVNATGTVSPDGNTQEGTWADKSYGYAGAYLGSRLVPTTTGSDVTVEFPGAGATVTFGEVAEGGASQLIMAPTAGGILPGNFQVIGEFYNVITNAAISGDLNFCVSYQDKDDDGFVDDTSPPIAEEDLQLLHNEGGTFVDRTNSGKTDFETNTICAVVPGLSEFALGAGAEEPTPTDTPAPTDTPRPPASPPLGGAGEFPDIGGSDGSGGGAGLVAAIIAAGTAGAIALGGAAWYMRRRLR